MQLLRIRGSRLHLQSSVSSSLPNQDKSPPIICFSEDKDITLQLRLVNRPMSATQQSLGFTYELDLDALIPLIAVTLSLPQLLTATQVLSVYLAPPCVRDPDAGHTAHEYGNEVSRIQVSSYCWSVHITKVAD